jgi:hypothetical protein
MLPVRVCCCPHCTANHLRDRRLGVDRGNAYLRMRCGEHAKQLVRECLPDVRHAGEVKFDTLEALEAVGDALGLGA